MWARIIGKHLTGRCILPAKLPGTCESQGSLLCSQEPAIGPYPEPEESSPHPSILFN
jgi:hypothetical protein